MIRVDITIGLKQQTLHKHIPTCSQREQPISVPIELETKFSEVVLSHVVAGPGVGEDEGGPAPELHLAEDCAAAVGEGEPLEARESGLVVVAELGDGEDPLPAVVLGHRGGLLWLGFLLFRRGLLAEGGIGGLCHLVEVLLLELHLLEKVVQLLLVLLDVSQCLDVVLGYLLVGHLFSCFFYFYFIWLLDELIGVFLSFI